MAHQEVRHQVCLLQTGRAQRDLYVIPPRESEHRNELRLLLAAAHGLVNAISKWQVQLDAFFKSFRLECMQKIPQLFIQLDGCDSMWSHCHQNCR